MTNFFRQISARLSEIRTKKIAKKNPPKKTSKPKSAGSSVEAVPVELQISSLTLIKVLLVIALFFAGAEIIIQLKTILITTVICGLLAMGVSPFLDDLERKKIPRPVAILILYMIFFGILTVVFFKVVPVVAEQLLGIARDLRNFVLSSELKIPFLDQFGEFSFKTDELQQLLAQNLTDISQNLKTVAGSTVGLITGIFQGLFNFIFTLVLLFFILLEREKIGNFLLALFPDKDQLYVLEKTKSIKKKMSEWFRGQFILMMIVGIAMYIGMKIFEYWFGMKYAATIAIFAGMMELFPYVGMILSTSLAAIIAINISGATFVAVLIWMASIQFLEGNFLVPIIMEKAIGLSSAVVLLVLAIGATLGYATGGITTGLLGMIFSVPIAASIGIFVDDYTYRKKK